VLLLYIGLYLVGMLLGLAAKIALDVQLRRPDLRQAAGLVTFALLVWAGTGLLAGIGSREHAVG
jgi:hypothetical protein